MSTDIMTPRKEQSMNMAQSRHAKAMARKIKTHAESMALSMGAIEREDLEDIPLDVAKNHFSELEGYWRSIKSVIDDMLPDLDEQ